MKKIQKSGITIVTLVITVVVLAVLTGAVMLTMVGDNGIFGETQTTIDKYNKQAMLEQIQLKIQKKRLAKVNEGQYSLKLEEDILPILETFGTYNESEMKLTTTEKNIDIYLYEIVNIPIKEIANVTYTNEELTITEKVTLPNGYTFEYTKDNGISWSEYTNATTIAEENGILIRLKNEEGKVVSSEYKVTSGVIEEIDSTKPIISIDTNGVTTGKTIKVTIIVTDEKGLDRNNTYEYCISTSNNDISSATWLPYTNGIPFTVGEGLTGGYYIHVKGVKDTAGNESENKVSEMLTFDNTLPSITMNIGRITDTSIEVLAQSTDNSGQVKSTEYSIDNGTTWKSTNTFTNLTANTSYAVQVKSVDIFNNENIEEKQVTTNPRRWNGKIDISWYTKDPNKTTFDISTPNELAGLALLVDNEIAYYDDPHDANATSGTYSIAGSEFEGKTIVLNNDILINENVLNEEGTLNEANASSFVQWEPIGDVTRTENPDDEPDSYGHEAEDQLEIEHRKFSGIFNGQEYAIKGMYINKGIEFDQALFSNNYGTVKNIQITDSYVHSEGQYIASVVGSNWGNIENCINEGTIILGDYYVWAGGIVGVSRQGNIQNCKNNGDIKGHYVGGIAGAVYNTEIIKSDNNASMNIDDPWCAGGITSHVYENSIVKECNNYGDIYADYCGGIASHLEKSIIQDCNNEGDITAIANQAAGIVRFTQSVGESQIINCNNSGEVVAYIRGAGICSTANNCMIRDCKNSGNIKSSPLDTGGNYSGGISAFGSNSVLLNCTNYGNVQCANNSGGICGVTQDCSILNCGNFSNIINDVDTGGGRYVGGVLAWFEGNGEIVNSFNVGKIFVNNANSSDTIAGGIFGVTGNAVGDFKSDTVLLKNCFNFGAIESVPAMAGGLCGTVGLQSVELKNCYNLSNKIVGGKRAGGLVGNLAVGFQEVNHDISNCYNIDTTYFGSDIPSTATVTNTGLINADGTFPNSTPYPDLLTALNAWVDANKATYPELKNWVMGDNGYPTFAD